MVEHTFPSRWAAEGWHPFRFHYGQVRSCRVVKSTGQPKKATPEGTPTFFPVLLTTLDVWAARMGSVGLDIASLVGTGDARPQEDVPSFVEVW